MSVLAGGVPVVPDADEARRWARDELADEVYAAAEPGLVQRVVQWVVDRLAEIELPEGGASLVWLVLALFALAVAVVAALWLAGPVRLRRSRRRDGADGVLGASLLTAAEHRAAADRHAAAGQWDDAVRERFRAVVRSLDERALLRPTPGMTADEVARDAGALLPDVAADLAAGARLFDDVQYGGRAATAEHDTRMRDVDAAVAAARPVATASAG